MVAADARKLNRWFLFKIDLCHYLSVPARKIDSNFQITENHKMPSQITL